MLRSLAALLSALLILAGCADDADRETSALPASTSGTTADSGASPPVGRPPAPPTATATEDQSPVGDQTAGGATQDDIAVALGADGRVVVLDATTGDERRELLDGVPVDDPAANDLAMTPDTTHVYVVVPPEDATGASQIVRLAVEGGEPEVIAEGTVPSVSPDGGTLAFVTYEERTDVPAGHPEPVLVLHDVASGEQTRLTRDEPFVFIPEVEWTGDGAHVVFTAGEIHTGLYAVASDATTLDAARRLGPDPAQDETGTTSWGPVAAIRQERLAVVETCCGVGSEERWGLTAVDVADGNVHDDPLPDQRVEATHLDSDPHGELLIVVRGGPDGGQVLRWNGQGSLEPLADGIIAAAW